MTTPPCPICSGGTEFCSTIGERDLTICGACRHISWATMPSEREVAEHYQSIYAEENAQRELQEAGRPHYQTHALELAGLVASDRPVVADYGCAWPVFLDEALKSNHFSRLIGVDYDPATREHGASLGFDMFDPVSFIDEVADGSIDIIRFSHVIEHMIDPVSTMSEILKKVSPGGLVYITQPIFPVLFEDARPQQIKDAVYPEHLHFFNPISLHRLLEPLGCRTKTFWAFQKEGDVYNIYNGQIDADYAEQEAGYLRSLRSQYSNPLGTSPWFCGENLAYFAELEQRSC